ncbi:FtsK/SpoIIIE family DNA translocase [Clostridium arbusti]|uniref:FtsK/SpoIIIE family DNA translocase n=1 Tax=Clostridium arbusti TaxID=1137848 RepID=UPI00028A21DB|nr:DNA translocase FtsK [Clostridium arbusti]
MSRRRNVKNNTSNQSSTLNSDIAGIILICFGIFIIFSLFFTNTSGIFGKGMRKLLFTIIGIGSYAFPFIIIVIGIGYMVKRGSIGFSKKFYGIILFIINTLLLITMINISDYYSGGQVIEGIKNIYNTNNIMHGGVVSFIIDVPLLKFFGKGCYVVFFCIYIVSFVLISKKSLGDALKKTLLLHKRQKQNVDETKKYNIDKDDNDNILKDTLNKINVMEFIKNKPDTKNDESKAISESDIKIKDSNDRNNSNSNKEIPSEAIGEELEKEIEDNSIKDINGDYELPRVDFLNENELSKLNKSDKKELLTSATKLTDTLNSFGVDAKVIQVTKGPSVTRYELQPSAGVKVSKIVNLADDIALNLASAGVRIEAPIPGKAAIGIEVPNKDLTPVYLREVIESDAFSNTKSRVAFCLGKDIGGNCVVSDLSKMPHMLIAGATGSGKSVCINTLIISILYKYLPDDVKLLMIDPKVVELSIYNGIPHLLIPVVTNPKKAAGALSWAVNEMTKRYKMFADNSVRNIEGYNELYHKGKIDNKLPWIVIIIDELADLMMVCPNDVEDYIGRLAQMARAAGMHLVIATQRPSVDVITGVIKANIPSRISFAVSSQIDSRTILDTAGAEKLLGKGDMLFYPVGESKPLRIQGAFISEEEVEKVVAFIKDQNLKSEYREEIIEEINNNSVESKSGDEDELLNEAIKIIVEADQASTSLIQRKLRIGYNRAARIVEQLEEKGIISQRDGSKPRNILIAKEDMEKL